MESEIVDYNEPSFQEDGKTWIKVAITLEGLSQLNKIIIGDEPDADSNQEKLRNQMHNDCLKLFKRFKSQDVLEGRK